MSAGDRAFVLGDEAVVILAELGMDRITLGNIKSRDNFRIMEPMLHKAWDDHGLLVQRILRRERLTNVYTAYALLFTFSHSVALLQHELDESVASIREMKLLGEGLNEDQIEDIGRRGAYAQDLTHRLDDVVDHVRTTYLPAVEEGINALSRFRPFER